MAGGLNTPELDLVEPDGWEPATFVMECPHGHRWGSYGRCFTGLTVTRWPKPDVSEECPRRGCGLPWQMMEVYTGPSRPAVVEPEESTAGPIAGVRTPETPGLVSGQHAGSGDACRG
jgi:hypothetical protein